MFQGVFGWIRRSAHAAVIGGIQDAIAELQTTKIEEPEAEPLRLTFQVEKEAEPEPAKRREAKR